MALSEGAVVAFIRTECGASSLSVGVDKSCVVSVSWIEMARVRVRVGPLYI